MASRFQDHPTEEKFEATDAYICATLLPPDAGLDEALAANEKSLPAIDVAPNQGKMLYLLAKINKAKRILEVGTLGGYSAIWFAKAVGLDGKVVTLELEPEHAKIAQSNIENAGFGNVVEIKIGAALDTLEKMGKEGKQEFDMVFIDADKENNLGYFKWALEFSHVGTVIVVDNIARSGRLLGEGDPDAAKGTALLFEYMKTEKRIEATAVQTVGMKGWDGFAMALVVE